MDTLLLPDNAIAIFRSAVWRPDAARFYEVMSGGFWWTDELVREASRVCVGRDNWSFRYLMGYRALVVRGEPDERLRPAWEQVRRECPGDRRSVVEHVVRHVYIRSVVRCPSASGYPPTRATTRLILRTLDKRKLGVRNLLRPGISPRNAHHTDSIGRCENY